MSEHVSVSPVAWEDVEADQPIAKLTRRKIEGEHMLVAHVLLEKGCVVALHRHVSEQVAMVQSGRVRWTLGAEGEQETVEMVGGQALRLPSNVWHGVEALEDTVIIDVLSPPGAMGVDSQEK